MTRPIHQASSDQRKKKKNPLVSGLPPAKRSKTEGPHSTQVTKAAGDPKMDKSPPEEVREAQAKKTRLVTMKISGNLQMRSRLETDQMIVKQAKPPL